MLPVTIGISKYQLKIGNQRNNKRLENASILYVTITKGEKK